MGLLSIPLAEVQDNAKLLTSQIEALEQLNEVGQHCVRPAHEFEACLSVIMKAAIVMSAADKGTVQLYDARANALKLVAHRGFEPPLLEFFESATTQGSACESAMRMRQRVIVRDITESGQLVGMESLQVLLVAGIRAVQCTPLISSSGGLLGMISTHYGNPVTPPEWRLTLMDLLARQVADYLERRQMERALKDSEDQLRRFVDAVPIMIIRCSRDFRYLSTNPAATALLGFPPEQIIGKSIAEVIGPGALEVLRPRIDRVLEGETVEFEDEVPYLAAGRRYVHASYSPEKDEQGQVVGWVASFADLTEFHQLQQRVAEVERLAAAAHLAAALAHEINNPLNGVMNCLYLLQTGTSDACKAEELLQAASSELARVGRIVKQNLSYYRVDTKPQMVDLALLVADSVQVFEQKCRTAQVQICTKARPVSCILSNSDELRQVIDNLLLNAVESMRDGGSLTIAQRAATTVRGKRGVRLTIADTGCGIASEHRERIFEPFFSTKAEKGRGLGLWIVRGILAKHGASIRVRSSCGPGRSGTVVSVVFLA